MPIITPSIFSIFMTFLWIFYPIFISPVLGWTVAMEWARSESVSSQPSRNADKFFCAPKAGSKCSASLPEYGSFCAGSASWPSAVNWIPYSNEHGYSQLKTCAFFCNSLMRDCSFGSPFTGVKRVKKLSSTRWKSENDWSHSGARLKGHPSRMNFRRNSNCCLGTSIARSTRTICGYQVGIKQVFRLHQLWVVTDIYEFFMDHLPYFYGFCPSIDLLFREKKYE